MNLINSGKIATSTTNEVLSVKIFPGSSLNYGYEVFWDYTSWRYGGCQTEHSSSHTDHFWLPVGREQRRLSREYAAKRKLQVVLKLGVTWPSKSLLPSSSFQRRIMSAGLVVTIAYRIWSLSWTTYTGFCTKFVGKKNFPSVYLVKAFRQISVAKEDLSKTAIYTPFGLFGATIRWSGVLNFATLILMIYWQFLQELFRSWVGYLIWMQSPQWVTPPTVSSVSCRFRCSE